MSLTIQQQQALLNLYPQVVTIRGDVAYDQNEQEVNYDLAAVNAWQDPHAYKIARAKEYPDFREYLDGIVKGDQAQIDKYIADCQAVKAKYPKGA